MLSNNIIMLRNLNGFTQEEVAEKIGISRQAYAKWEKGETTPDIERCMRLAELYGTSIDALVRFEGKVGNTELTPAPRGKHIFGTVTINDRGQVVIPKKAREMFNIQPNDSLVILGDEAEGIAIIKADVFETHLNQIWENAKRNVDEKEKEARGQK